LTSFERFIYDRERETLYLILSFTLSRWTDLKIDNVMKCRSFGDSMGSRVSDQLETIRLSCW